MPTELNNDNYFVSKVVTAAAFIGIWVWRTAINYDRYMTLRNEVKELKAAHYITKEELELFKKNCRTEVKLNQNVALKDISEMIAILIAKVDMLLQERDLDHNNIPDHRRRRTDYPIDFSVRTDHTDGLP